MHEKSSDYFGLHDHLMGTGEFSGGKVPGQPLHCAYTGSHETYETARDIRPHCWKLPPKGSQYHNIIVPH